MNSYEKLKTFFDSRKVAHKATKPLGKKAKGEVIFLEDETKSYSFGKYGEKFGTIIDEKPKDPDFTIKIAEGAVDELIKMESESVGDFGVKFFKLLRNKSEGKEVYISINIGLLKIISKGYLKVFLLGGPVVIAAIGKFGVNGIAGLKRKLSKKKRDKK